jgi:hypothetical protein
MITTSSVSGLRERTVGWFLGILIALAAGHARQLAGAEIPRALPEGKIPADQRLEPLKDLDGYFPFVPPATKEQWAKRAEVVRRRLLVTLGLWPMPSKQP